MIVKFNLYKHFLTLLNNTIKLRQNYNILDNLLKANCVTKNEYDVIIFIHLFILFSIIKARITRYLIDKKNWNKITVAWASTRASSATSATQAANLTKASRFQVSFSMQ